MLNNRRRPFPPAPKETDPQIIRKLVDVMVKDARIRTEVTRASHYWFFLTYLPDYIKHSFADFHHEMLAITEDEALKMGVVIAFRGSGKSTIFTLSYPIWAVLGKPQKKFVVLVAQTQAQAKLYLTNVKRELESNALLRADLGPFEEKQEEWSAGSLVIPKYGARITAVSTEQSIRGIRHGSHRPDLLICDDLEDIASVKTHEGRQKMWQWLMGDVIPSGDQNTKVICVGNMLHESSLLMRLKEEILAGTRDGVCHTYPLLKEDGTPTWPGKFRALENIEKLRRTVDDISWSREYLLKIVSDTDRVIWPEWIRFQDEILSPTDTDNAAILTGVDLAISQRDSADFTAMVSAEVRGYGRDLKIRILPHPINQRLTFPETLEALRWMHRTNGGLIQNQIYVENVQYQESLVQAAKADLLPVEGVHPGGNDKRSRLALISEYVKSGTVLFPRHGCEQLIAQITGFGYERFDDLADAFSILVTKAVESRLDRPATFQDFIDLNNDPSNRMMTAGLRDMIF